MISDLDLLKSCSNITFEHRILVYLPEQIIHRRRWLFCEGLKKCHARTNALLEDLRDDIHIVRYNLEHCVPEPFHEVP